jgi:hypothetical protein
MLAAVELPGALIEPVHTLGRVVLTLGHGIRRKGFLY